MSRRTGSTDRAINGRSDASAIYITCLRIVIGVIYRSAALRQSTEKTSPVIYGTYTLAAKSFHLTGPFFPQLPLIRPGLSRAELSVQDYLTTNGIKALKAITYVKYRKKLMYTLGCNKMEIYKKYTQHERIFILFHNPNFNHTPTFKESRQQRE